MEGPKAVNNNHPEEDMGEGMAMACTDHPFRTNNGGICAFCLQEKLGKLVSSSFSYPIQPSSISSSSSPPSFRSERAVNGGNAGTSSASLALSLSNRPRNGVNGRSEFCNGRAKIPFLLAKKKKKIMAAGTVSSSSTSSDRASSDAMFKRSKSTTAARRGVHFFGANGDESFSPRKRNGFWSFLHLSSKSNKKMEKNISRNSNTTVSANGSSMAKSGVGSSSSLSRKGGILIEEEEDDDDDSPNTVMERKVSRSRSVGCGSRSFSGDFFERISTGFGDCTLRRVESQREGKTKAIRQNHNNCMKDRVKCGGIFGGFTITSSSSSSSSSSIWVSSDMNGKPALGNGRSRSWSWAFASPMRAFTRHSSLKEGKRGAIKEAPNSTKTGTGPNLSAIPSLLAVGR